MLRRTASGQERIELVSVICDISHHCNFYMRTYITGSFEIFWTFMINKSSITLAIIYKFIFTLILKKSLISSLQVIEMLENVCMRCKKYKLFCFHMACRKTEVSYKSVTMFIMLYFFMTYNQKLVHVLQ